MSMVTRCPGCATTFRVTPPQLQAQHGMVRCGRCATVFDGFKTLAALAETGPAHAEPRGAGDAADVAPQSAPAMRATAPTVPAPAVAPPLDEPAAQAKTGAQLPREIPAFEPLPPAALSAPAPRPSTAHSAPMPQPAFAEEPFIAEAQPRKRSAAWAVGAFVLLLALAAQGAYFYRSEIAASVPEARPYLNRMCDYLRCTVALPQRPRSINIEASDMQAIDPANPGLIALTATLRNHAPTELGYPALDVVLTNTREHTVARRIFLPSEYLETGADPRAGIPANAEITLRLNIDSGDIGAAGFRLDLLPAPGR
jgi:predicted Zn finger-like uncharacterized protein